MIYDFAIFILKWHFAFYFTLRNWLLKNIEPVGIIYKYIGGVIFVIHDYLTNRLLDYKFDEKIGNLVTDRLKHYKAIEPVGSDKYIWAVELCDFANEFDKDHC